MNYYCLIIFGETKIVRFHKQCRHKSVYRSLRRGDTELASKDFLIQKKGESAGVMPNFIFSIRWVERRTLLDSLESALV